MTGVVRLALLYARRTPFQTAVVAASIAVAAALPIAGRVLVERYEHRLQARSVAVPLIVGAQGSRFDLLLAALFFRQTPAGVLPLGAAETLADGGRATVVPIHARHTARGVPVVAVGFEYFELLALTPVRGRLPGRIGEAVLGANTAESLKLRPGDAIRTDRRELYDLSVPPPVNLAIVGILRPTGTADDDAVFVDLETAWVIEGFSHAHAPADRLDQADIVFEGEGAVALRPTLETITDITEATGDDAFDFHLHADRATLPLSAALVFPNTEKDRTILEATVNTDGEYQAVRPVELVDELFEFVLRVRTVFDGIAVLLGVATVSLVVLTTVLASRLRRDEFEVLDRIGAPRGFVAGLVVAQSLLVLILGGVASAGAVGTAVLLADAWIGI
ncbi:MAG: ABC transporter permease [Phycisphaerales bacterium]